MSKEDASKTSLRFRDRSITFDNGAAGTNIEIPSASPRNYYQAISQPQSMPKLTIDGKLFLPPGSADNRFPVVIVAPGSLGVSEANLKHAEAFTNTGIAALVLDSFGARSVTSTVANQTQFSFAASAYDVLAACKVLSSMSDIDARRIGAQGHSRGGAAVLMAASERLAEPTLTSGEGLWGVYAAYPWCGHQFVSPHVGHTVVRVVIGDRDEWCSPMQAQAFCHSVRLTGGDASLRLVGKAHHSFDRGTPLTEIPDAKISPAAPIAYIADDGAFVHPLEDRPNPDLVDRDLMVYALKAGYGKTGARIGSGEGEAKLFDDDMMAFWSGLARGGRESRSDGRLKPGT